MDLQEFKKQQIKEQLGIREDFGIIHAFVDFAPLLRYLKGSGKKTLLIKGGYIQDTLKQASDVVINAQDIKQYIAMEKQKPGS